MPCGGAEDRKSAGKLGAVNLEAESIGNRAKSTEAVYKAEDSHGGQTRVQELCGSRGRCPGLSALMSLTQ